MSDYFYRSSGSYNIMKYSNLHAASDWLHSFFLPNNTQKTSRKKGKQAPIRKTTIVSNNNNNINNNNNNNNNNNKKER